MKSKDTNEHDFKLEYSRLAAFFKELFDKNEQFKAGLYKEFTTLEPVPKLELFIDLNLTEKDKQDFGKEKTSLIDATLRGSKEPVAAAGFLQTGPVERKINDLMREFNNSISTIDKRYWGRYLSETPTLIMLTEIKEIFDCYQQMATEDNPDFIRVREAGWKIKRLIGELQIPGLGEVVISRLINEKINIYIIMADENKRAIYERKYTELRSTMEVAINSAPLKNHELALDARASIEGTTIKKTAYPSPQKLRDIFATDTAYKAAIDDLINGGVISENNTYLLGKKGTGVFSRWYDVHKTGIIDGIASFKQLAVLLNQTFNGLNIDEGTIRKKRSRPTPAVRAYTNRLKEK